MRRVTLAALLALGLAGCGGKLVRLAEQGRWAELDREARASDRLPTGKAARAWARALVELGQVDEARALLLRDFRTGGRDESLLQLATLEAELGLRGLAAAHFGRLHAIDDLDLRDAAAASVACELFRARAAAMAALGDAFAADTDLRRLADICPQRITQADRELLAELTPLAREQARAQRTLDGRDGESLASSGESVGSAELRLASELELARKRSPRALADLADAEQLELEPSDVASLLAAELGGGLGPGLVSSRRLSGWVGNRELGEVVDAIAALPDGAREYALLRLASVRPSERLGDDREAWIVAAMHSLDGQGPREAAKAWRVAAASGDAAGAEFALNGMRALAVKPEPGSTPIGLAPPWWMTVPVDRQTFDLLLDLARLFELRGEKRQDALMLRRRVIAAGYEGGLAQVAEVALDEVRRQLILGQPWSALAIAEVVPGPLVDELVPTLASTLALRRAIEGEGEGPLATEQAMVGNLLGAAWVAGWAERLTTPTRTLAAGGAGCPSPASWLDPGEAERLREVGLDPEAGRAALEQLLGDPADAAASGPSLARALESDVALACSGPVVIPLLVAGLHEPLLDTLDERLIHAPELAGAWQHQLHAELALGHGQFDRAALLTTSAAALSGDPRSLWRRAAIAGREAGAREYTLEALRQVLLHSPGLHDAAARRELLLTRLRDVDHDAVLRDEEREVESGATEHAREELRRALGDYLAEAPRQQRWSRHDALIEQLAGETRADARAWQLLAELLIDDDARERHGAAVEAFERAALAGATAGQPGRERGVASTRELAYLSDADALCRLGAADPAALVGIALACAPRVRAEALAELLALPGARARVQAVVLAGLSSVQVDASAPGSLRSEPALARDGLLLRVLFDLPRDAVWIVDPLDEGARARAAGAVER